MRGVATNIPPRRKYVAMNVCTFACRRSFSATTIVLFAFERVEQVLVRVRDGAVSAFDGGDSSEEKNQVGVVEGWNAVGRHGGRSVSRRNATVGFDDAADVCRLVCECVFGDWVCVSCAFLVMCRFST